VAALIVGARTAPAQPGKVDQHGSRFTLMIPVAGPTGSATMTTGWIYGPGKKIPSLTTLYIET
jgi:filamentous hemagglutinin